MKFILSVIISLILIYGCSENDVTSPQEDNGQPFVIHPLEYSKNHYFLDPVYKNPQYNIFHNYYGHAISIVSKFYTVKNIEAWKTTTGISVSGERRANLDNYIRRVIPLVEGKDYLFNKYVGIISLLKPIQDSEALAVAYQIEGNSPSEVDDIKYGQFSNESNNELTLKVVKQYYYPGDDPPYLQLKNVYFLGNKNISSNNFSFDIYFMPEKNKPSNSFEGVKLLETFGFDSDSDGKFDFIEGKTIISQTGEIIFPSLEPFGDNLPEIFFKRQQDTLISPYQIKSIYNNSSIYAASDSNASKYYFYGKYYTR